MEITKELMDLIIQANKLGAKGQKVVALVLPYTATQSNIGLVIEEPENISASETNWYDK